jgi:hypothetical protein
MPMHQLRPLRVILKGVLIFFNAYRVGFFKALTLSLLAGPSLFQSPQPSLVGDRTVAAFKSWQSTHHAEAEADRNRQVQLNSE